MADAPAPATDRSNRKSASAPLPQHSRRFARLMWATFAGLSVIIVGVIAAKAEIELDRGALWRVVNLCAAMDRSFGISFPCVQVELSGDGDDGYVVLKPPVGSRDFILSPTRRIVGIEDPALGTPSVPNYVADAWDVGASRLQRLGSDDRISSLAVAVNPRKSRTQDQLHIHIGCQTPWVRRALLRYAPLLEPDSWTELGQITGDGEFWALKVDKSAMRRVDPIRMAKDHFAASLSDFSRLIVMVAALPGPNTQSVAILAADARDPRSGDFASTRELVDAACVQ